MQTRICSTCKVNPVRNDYSYKCKECHCEYQKAYYKKNPKSIRTSSNKKRIQMRDYIMSFKNKSCMDCNIKYPYYVMDFDHVRGEKSFNISSASHMIKNKDLIDKEIAKCEVVCANCHRERTFKRLSGSVIGNTEDFESSE